MSELSASPEIPHLAKFSADCIEFGLGWSRWKRGVIASCVLVALFGWWLYAGAQQNNVWLILFALIGFAFLYEHYRLTRGAKAACRIRVVSVAVPTDEISDEADIYSILRSEVRAVEIHYQNLRGDNEIDGEYEIWLSRRDAEDSLPVFTTRKYGKLLRVAMQTADFCQTKLVFHRSSRKARKLNRAYCGWLLPVIATPPLIWGVWLATRQFNMLAWPETVAVIDQFKANAHPAGEYSWYANPTIQYHYSVNGNQYTSDRFNPSPLNYQSKDSFQEDTGDFKPDANVPCWYRESNPADAYVVNRGITIDVWLIILASLGLDLLYVWGRREAKKLPALIQAAEQRARDGPGGPYDESRF